ncbi:MAG: YggT family protein [Candidatus Gracilibacteria bacterium]|nr:YggT family protein [Candidatus Gracilibacteria bacterium]
MALDLTWLVQGVVYFFRALTFLIFARVIFSWLVPRANGPVVLFVHQCTEPILAPIRNRLPRSANGMMMDWSPLIALLLIDLTRYASLQLIFFLLGVV